MKTYGNLSIQALKDGRWLCVQLVPHIRIKLKTLFARVDKYEFGECRILVTPEACRDMQWFVQRYPLVMADETRAEIEGRSKEHQLQIDELEEILSPAFKARPLPLAKPLREYQSRAVAVHARTKGLLLGDQLGLGKTVSAIGTFAAGGTLPVLVVCPTHLSRQWRDFLKVFMPKATWHIVKQTAKYHIPAVDVVIITYSKLAPWAEHFDEGRFKSIVFDEVQELRREDSRKYRGARHLAGSCEYRLGLSATPIYNYGGEIFNIMQVVNPDRMGTREEFYREWCTCYGPGKWMIKDPEACGAYLRDEFLMLRRRREDVGLELPKVQRESVTVPYREEVIDEIQEDATELARLILEGTFLESGQAAREFDAKMRQATGIAKAPAVADFVRMLVESGEKVLLFGWHRAVFDVWLEKLKDFRPVLYTGTESPAQKEQALADFKDHLSQVMIMSLRSGSGVDGLQEVCSTCVFGELDWSPGVHEQCVGRLNRDGLKGGVLVYFLVTDAGSDPVVASVLGLKTEQAVGLVDPDKAGETVIVQSDTARVKKLAQDWLEKKSNFHRRAPHALPVGGENLGASTPPNLSSPDAFSGAAVIEEEADRLHLSGELFPVDRDLFEVTHK